VVIGNKGQVLNCGEVYLHVIIVAVDTEKGNQSYCGYVDPQLWHVHNNQILLFVAGINWSGITLHALVVKYLKLKF
jgi:hypothetical protein